MDDVSTSDGRVSDAAQQFAAPEALRWERPASLTTRDRALTRLTRGQRGHVTFGQLIELGFSRSWWQARVRSGTLVKVHRNVVRLGSVPATEEGAVVAACLAIPGPAYASQTTAAALWRLGDLRLAARST